MFYNLFVPLNSESQWNNHSFPTGKNWWPFFLLTPPRGSNSQPFRFTNGAYEYMSLTLCLIELGGLWGSKIGGVLHAHFLAMIPNQSVLHKCNFAYKLGVRYPDVSNWIRLKSDGKDHSERHRLNKKTYRMRHSHALPEYSSCSSRMQSGLFAVKDFGPLLRARHDRLTDKLYDRCQPAATLSPICPFHFWMLASFL